MNANVAQSRLLTELDHRRIESLIKRNDADDAPNWLDDADLVPSTEVPDDIVTMYTQVMLLDLDLGRHRQITVCYPPDAEPGEGFVSVLSPLGSALLGRRRGDEIVWHAQGRPAQRGRIVEILFQPEASGDYTM